VLQALDPLLSFIVSLVLLFILILVKVDVAIAVLTFTLLFGILSTSFNEFIVGLFKGITGTSTINLLLALTFALFLASLLRTTGVLEKTTKLFQTFGLRFASYSVPAIVGLIPMPGGALVSAMMLKRLYFERLKLKTDFASYLNHWFRHIWVPSWPLYQSIIITASLLNTSVTTVITSTFLASIGSIIAGLIVSSKTMLKLHNVENVRDEFSWKLVLEGLWPFILIIFLVFIVKLNIITSLALTIIATILCKRPKVKDYVEALKFALSPKILTIIFSVMIYKEFIVLSGATEHYNIPTLAIASIIPFLIGIVASGEFLYVAIAFPILLKILAFNGVINKLALLVAFTSGYLSVMLSPAHLCIVLTTEYYSVKLYKVYKYTIPSVLIALGITLTLGFMLYG